MKSKQIYIVGDLHNDFSVLIYNISKYNIKNTIFICVGDFGAYYDLDHLNEESLLNLNNLLIKNKCDLYSVRGNHDNPKNYDNRTYGNVHLIKDYSVLDFNNYNFLFMGGGISIDRKRRQEFDVIDDKINNINIVQFKNEEFILDEEQLSKFKNINIVITHISSSGNFPYTKLITLDNDLELEKDLIKERHNMGIAKNIVIKNNSGLRKWFYGHYHQHYSEIVNNIEYTCLGKNDIYPIFL